MLSDIDGIAGQQVDFNGRPFHFIGIGGIGMSAIASVLLEQKLLVSGSDKTLNHITQRLQQHGAHIFETQDADNLTVFSHKTPQVICSTAISASNAEYQAALSLGCPIFHRSDVLAGLMQRYRGIAVAGTHGKTTTTSMMGYVLLKAGLDPTIIVGGEVTAWQGNARTGRGTYLLAEADESDGSLVKLSPQIGIVTNVELDHPDHYASIDDVVQIFRQFSQQCQILIASADCETVSKALSPTTTYGIAPGSSADYVATDIDYSECGTRATVWEYGQRLGELKLQVLGAHNLSNSMAAVVLGRLLGLPFDLIAEALSEFEGARRRYEFKGRVNQITFIDDYAHHPSEIQATLAAARLQAQSGRRIVAIFQPHRYSRTLAFLTEFSQAFEDADQVVLTDIYAAGEAESSRINGEMLASAVQANHGCVVYQPTLSDVVSYLNKTLRPGDVALFLGAGNLNQVIPDLMASYQQQDVEASLPL
ncbi:MAG: UDP-N-acetylmuramate--L-alanine ligase [Elainellaceae cyanobacterium]